MRSRSETLASRAAIWNRILICAVSITIVLLSACSNTGRVDLAAANSGAADALAHEENVALGKVIYTNNCASCHGANLEGEANWKQQNEDGSFRSPPHTADGHTWHHADNVLIEAIEKGGARFEGMNIGGSSNMPAFAETLTDEHISAVLEYIKSTWPEDVQEIQRQQTEQTPSS